MINIISQPLIVPKHISQFQPDEYADYLRTIVREPRQGNKKPPREFTMRFNRKGTPVITVRRQPKYLTRTEYHQLAKEHGVALNDLYLWLKRRSIPIYNEKTEADEITKQINELPW